MRATALVPASLIIYGKNGRVNSDVRLKALLAELLVLEWDIIFSETRCTTRDIILEGGHRFIANLSSPGASGTAILINQRLVKKIMKSIPVSDRVLATDVRIGKRILRIISVYVPHAGYPWSDFEICMNEMSGLIMEGADQGKHCIIAGDFNLSLHRGDRGVFMDDFCNQHQVRVINGEGLDSAEHSWTFRSQLGTLRRIDFILASPGIVNESANAVWDVDLGSDHRAVKASASFMMPDLDNRKKSPSRKGWKPTFNDDGRATKYQTEMDTLLNSFDNPDLRRLGDIMKDAADSDATSNGPKFQRPEKSEILLALIEARKRSRCRGERANLSKSIYKQTRMELRRWRTLWADHLLSRCANLKYLQKINSSRVKKQACPIDPDDFAAFLELLFASLGREIVAINLDILAAIPRFSLLELEEALKKLPNMRCADEQDIVGEMVKYSSVQFKTELLRCFNESMHSGRFDENWYHTCFQMLPKSGDLTQVSNWRPSAILPILYKVFARMVYDRISARLFEYQSRDQHAFTPSVRIEDALLCAETSIQYALEFNVPLWFFNMDLRKSF